MHMYVNKRVELAQRGLVPYKFMYYYYYIKIISTESKRQRVQKHRHLVIMLLIELSGKLLHVTRNS